MAICSSCGAEIGLFKSYGPDGSLCKPCNIKRLKSSPEATVKEQEKQQRSAAIEAIMLTTEAYPEGLKITERIEVVTAECAFGMNIFKDLFAGVRDIVGGRSEAVQKTMRDSRRVALYELKREAYEVGADAVIGVDLDYIELAAAGSMVLLVASGTAVKLANG